jgi:hypothetical protein
VNTSGERRDRVLAWNWRAGAAHGLAWRGGGDTGVRGAYITRASATLDADKTGDDGEQHGTTRGRRERMRTESSEPLGDDVQARISWRRAYDGRNGISGELGALLSTADSRPPGAGEWGESGAGGDGTRDGGKRVPRAWEGGTGGRTRARALRGAVESSSGRCLAWCFCWAWAGRSYGFSWRGRNGDGTGVASL